MNAYETVKTRFIKPFEGRSAGNVGVELEFPLLNMDKKPVDEKIADGLLSFFLENGFHTEETTKDGRNAFIVNEAGDSLSFDNSYNNFEFAMNYGDNLCDIADRFYSYFEMVQSYLSKHNYLLTGMGTNPFKKYITQNHVNYPVYNMVDEFLHKYPSQHEFPDFPAYLSSVQTHLDISAEDLPFAATLFARLDFVRGMLFSNSPAWNSDSILCYRDYLWEGSAFPNTGKVDESYDSEDDIIQSFLRRKMFNRIRNGRYETFSPVAVKDYFDDEKYGADKNDIKQFLSFRNIEITARGTLEVRSDCAQPLSEAFAPPAFSLGILYNMKKAKHLLSDVLPDFSTSNLRNSVINGRNIKLPKNLLIQLAQLAEQGLKLRGKGEEKLLAPVISRAENNICPAKNTLSRLKKGEPIENIIKGYSDLSI